MIMLSGIYIATTKRKVASIRSKISNCYKHALITPTRSLSFALLNLLVFIAELSRIWLAEYSRRFSLPNFLIQLAEYIIAIYT